MLHPRRMRAARRLHVRLACFFTPLLLFFSVTGAAQLFMLHVGDKKGYRPPAVLEKLGSIHRYMNVEPRPAPLAAPFRYLCLALCAGLVATMVLGVLLAGASASAGEGWRLLAAGVLVPVLALWAGTLLPNDPGCVESGEPGIIRCDVPAEVDP